jgi:hypothetical protein
VRVDPPKRPFISRRAAFDRIDNRALTFLHG